MSKNTPPDESRRSGSRKVWPANNTGKRPVRIVYFCPQGTQPFENYRPRITRIMEDIQQFYRSEMEKNGFGPLTFELEKESDGLLKIYVVPGKSPVDAYNPQSWNEIKWEIEPALEQENVFVEREVLVVFAPFLKWENGQTTERGPFVGNGTALSGTAWVFDDPRLDAALLTSNEEGGYYFAPCSLGEFNTHYLGGIAHELGHAFGLPHECQNEEEEAKHGISLMGNGNHYYRAELRDPRHKSAFLTPSASLRLSTVRAFVGDLPQNNQGATFHLSDLSAQCREGKIVLSGQSKAFPALKSLIFYDDDQAIESDYDALSQIVPVESDGSFRAEIPLKDPGPRQLRMTSCHQNGAVQTISFDYEIQENRTVELDPFLTRVPLDYLVELFNAKKYDAALVYAQKIRNAFPKNLTIQAKMAFLIELLQTPPKPLLLSEIPENVTAQDVSTLIFDKMVVAWGQPLRNFVPESLFIEVNGEFFSRGIFAHAPSLCRLTLNRQWTTFETSFGIQDGHNGTVVFVLRGDGKELFRSDLILPETLGTAKVDVRDVEILELIVEDSFNSNASDWSVWIRPVLSRSLTPLPQEPIEQFSIE